MSVNYAPVLWNNQKKLYDKILWFGILLIMGTFVAAQLILRPEITAETLIIRATAFTAIILLHFILLIGPLCRLNPLFLPLLYNRRHLGVSMFFIAAIHGVFSIMNFHALGDINPIISVFTSNQNYAAISSFPFQIFGFFALIIFFLMAATSHDFWLKNLSPKVWKALHMSVYIAYGLIILHVATGTLQYESNPFYWFLLIGGFITISGLHLISGWKETQRVKTAKDKAIQKGFHEILPLVEISEKCATTVFINGENIAIFKYDNKVSAVHNVCKHQMGPIGEGKIVNGCITCPWHGYQYLPENGQSPAPFTEELKTFEVKIINKMVWVNPIAKAEGSFVEPAVFR
jgi:nitrite reductase/ring-hydroxylating ferredoxin subunit/DMSO/TMAO reductase YedYZ heme-binding membrane subunit